MNNSIFLKLGAPSDEIAVGKSHWWGYPDLPLDMDIPTFIDPNDGNEYALSFLCQINLADLHDAMLDAAYDTGDQSYKQYDLPKSGLLLFFADIAYYGGMWDEPAIGSYLSNNKVVRVVYVPEEDMASLICRQEEYADEELPAQPIDFCARLPKGEGLPEHKLLGTPDHHEWEDWDQPCTGWQLLLQMDSCEEDGYAFNFIDCGVLNLIISPEALKRHDFSNVRGIVLST